MYLLRLRWRSCRGQTKKMYTWRATKSHKINHLISSYRELCPTSDMKHSPASCLLGTVQRTKSWHFIYKVCLVYLALVNFIYSPSLLGITSFSERIMGEWRSTVLGELSVIPSVSYHELILGVFRRWLFALRLSGVELGSNPEVRARVRG